MLLTSSSRQILNLLVRIDTDAVEDRLRTGAPDAVNVGEPDFGPLSRRQINACNTRHNPYLLSPSIPDAACASDSRR